MKTFRKIFIVVLFILGVFHIVDGAFYEGTSPSWLMGVWILLNVLNTRTIIKNEKTIEGLLGLLNGHNSTFQKIDQKVVDKSIGDQIINEMSKSGQFVGFREINQAHKMGKAIEEEMAKGGGQA